MEAIAQSIPAPLTSTPPVPPYLVDAVRWDLSIHIGIHPDHLKLLKATPQTWPDTCLGLARRGELCGQQVISGWHILLSDGINTWGYRTDIPGQIRRLETASEEANFPPLLAQQVLKTAAEFTQQPLEELQIQQAIPQTWSDSCLELGGNNCMAVSVSGWQVTVHSERLGQTWVYRINRDARVIRLRDNPTAAVPTARGQLPESVAQAVFKDLAHRRRVPINALELVEFTPSIWPDSCLGIQPQWHTRCQPGEISGWRVVVKNLRRLWVYRTDGAGKVVYLENGSGRSQ